MESPEKTNVRVLRNRVVEKDGLSTPSKLVTPSKRGTPSKVASEASGITTRTRRRLSTKLENENATEKFEPRLVMSRLELRTPSKRGTKNVAESDKSPEFSQENKTRSTQKDSKKDETSPTGTKKGNLSVSSPQNKNVLLDGQSSPISDKKSKVELPPILENIEDSGDSIIENNSFQLELNVTDKTNNALQKSPSNKSPLINKCPDKSNREETIKSSSPNAQGKNRAHSSPGKSVSDPVHLETLESVEQDQNKALGIECESIVQEDEGSIGSVNQEEEESIESVDQEKGSRKSVEQGKESCKSVDQEEESNKSIDQEKGSSKSVEQGKEPCESVDQEEESNKSVDQERGSSKSVEQGKESCKSVDQEEESNKSVDQKEVETSKSPSQVEESSECSLEKECSETINHVMVPGGIVVIEEEGSDPADQDEESSQTICIEKESNKSIDPVSESICLEECNAADSSPNGRVSTENSSIVQSTRGSSPSKKCASDSEGDSNVVGEIVEAVKDGISLKGNNLINICLDDKSNSNDASFELVDKFQDNSAAITLHDDVVDESFTDIENSTEPVTDQLERKKLSESSPCRSSIKTTDSPKSSPSMVCSARKNSSPHEINKVTSPFCQRLPTGKISPSKAPHATISSSPERVVFNEAVSGKKIPDSDSDSDDSDSPQEIPSKYISQKKSPRSTDNEDVITKSTPSPNKILKLIKPIQSEKLYKLKNLIKSTYESQPITNAFKTLDESRKETSTDSDEVRISRKELTLIMKEAINDALIGLRKDVLEIRKELSDLKTLRRKDEEEKAKHLKEENMEECLVLAKRKKELVVEHLLAKQAAQIFSGCDSTSKKKSPKKNKESTKVLVVDEEETVQSNNSGSEFYSTLSAVTHQSKLKKRKMIEVQEEEEDEEIEHDRNIEEEEDVNLNANVEIRKKPRKRKRKTKSAVEKTEEEAIVPTHDVEPVEQSNNSEDHVVESELKPKKKKHRNRNHKNKDQETLYVESTNISHMNSSDAVDNSIDLSKKSKKKEQPPLLIENFNENNKFDHQTINEDKNEKKHKKKDAQQTDKVSSNNVFSPNLDRNDFDQQPLAEGKKKKKKKKKHIEQTDELNHQLSPENVVLNEFEQQPLHEVIKKKKKHVEEIDKFNRYISPKNVTSPNQNPLSNQLLKMKKHKLKKNLKPRSNVNISQQHLKSYMEEFCDLKSKDKVKLNSFDDGNKEVLESKDSKKLKIKNKGSVNNSFAIETGKKDVKHSKREAKDSSYKLTPSTTLDVTNFWL